MEQPKTPVQTNSNQPRRKIYLVLAFISAVLFAAIALKGYPMVERFVSKENPSATNTLIKDPRAFTYSKMDTVSMSGQSDSLGLKFEKPAEIKLVADGVDDKSSWGVYRHENNLKEVITTITAASSGDKQLANKEYLNRWSESFSEGEGPAYENATSGAKQFAQNVVGVVYDIELQKASKFSSSNLKDNAWQLEFTAKPKSETPLLPLRGKILIAGTEKGIYYFIVATREYNWSSNADTWGKVFESLQTDQK